jgi:hypothetical protein
MNADTKYIAGIAALVLAGAYSLSRLRDTSRGADGQAPTTDQSTPGAD